MQFYKKGFTIIELLVVITIVGILLVGFMSMNFSPSDQDKLNSFDIQIIAPINDAKNSALIGKGITREKDGELEIPDTWNIIIHERVSSDGSGNNGHNGKITTYYKLKDEVEKYDEDEKTFSVEEPFSVKQISYKGFDSGEFIKTSPNSFINLSFKGQTINISLNTEGPDDSNIKEVVICTSLRNKSLLGERLHKITINKVSGVVTKELAEPSDCSEL